MNRGSSVRVEDLNLECVHPNVFGCPNHGALARAMLRRGVYDWWRSLLEPAPLADREQWPCAMRVTKQGREAIRP